MSDETVQLQDVAASSSTDIPQESDEDLAVRGDVESFIRLYRSYLGPVYRYLYVRVGGNRQEAEDVTSLAFERAWTSIGSYKAIGSFRGWLFTIAARALADHYRGANARQVRRDTLADSLADPSIGPEESAMLTDQVRAVLRVIAGLREEQREVITLRFMAELRYSEIAAMLNKREAAVKMTAYRALDEVRRRYRDGEF